MRRILLEGRNATSVFQVRSDEALLSLFLATREEAAFDALVKRHERMVWGVCWRVLRHHQDASPRSHGAPVGGRVRRHRVACGEQQRPWVGGQALDAAFGRRGPPRKTARRQPLLAEPESLALVAEHCQRRPFAIAEDEYRADERIVLPRLPAPPRQAVKAPANRGRRDGHPDRPLRRALQPDWALQKRRRRAVTAAAS